MRTRFATAERYFRLATVLLLAIFSTELRGASPTPPPQPANIDRNSVLTLIRTTLVAVQQANQTNNYSVLYGISAPGFQAMNSPERLSRIFAKLREKGFDLSGVVVLEPQLTVLPELYTNGVMRMAGFFPSVPMQVYFDLQFIGVKQQWRLIAISVDVAPPGATAPVSEELPPSTPVPKAPSPAGSRPAASSSPTQKEKQ